MLRSRWRIRLATAAIFVGVILTIQIVTASGLVSTFLLPTPVQIARSFPSLITEEGLLHRLLLTAVEVLSAASLAILAGVFIGFGLYRSRNAWLAFNGWITGFNAAPHILVYPLFLVIFGRGSAVVIVIGVLSALPPIMLKTREALAGVRQVLLEVGQSFNLTPAQQFWKIHLPAATPTIVAGVRLALFYSMISVIGAEFLTGLGGVGALIPDLADRFQLPAMYGTIVFVILTSASFVALVKRIERWLTPG